MKNATPGYTYISICFITVLILVLCPPAGIWSVLPFFLGLFVASNLRVGTGDRVKGGESVLVERP